MKNLVMIHLESISNDALRKYPECFPDLTKLMAASSCLPNFFSSAPSSLMSFSDAMYGNSSEMDHIVTWDDVDNRTAGHQQHLFDILANAGYDVSGLGYPVISKDDVNAWDLFGTERRFDWNSDHDEFVAKLKNLSSSNGRPFASYVWELRSHLSYMTPEKPAEMRGFDRIKAGYKCLNDTVARVMRALEEAGVLDNTVIIGHGDHGDQLWTHGLYWGFCHAYEPYTEVVNTPAFIYEANRKPQQILTVGSSADLKATALDLLGIETTEAARWDSGTSLLSGKRNVAFCQTLFANQENNKALPKCYSASNDQYHMIVSRYGLEMYAHKVDPTNHNNLMSFFRLDGGDELSFNDFDCGHSHFKSVLNPAQIAEIRENIISLRRALAQSIREKFTAIPEEIRTHFFDVRGFLKARDRQFMWNTSNLDSDSDSPRCREEMGCFIRGEGEYAVLR